MGRLTIDAEFAHLQPVRMFGGQYLTYVLWAITPDGRAVNLGEVVPGGNGKDKLDVTTDLQAFGMIVTAEPYYAVTHPSNKVIAENIIKPGTKGFEEPIEAKFDLQNDVAEGIGRRGEDHECARIGLGEFLAFEDPGKDRSAGRGRRRQVLLVRPVAHEDQARLVAAAEDFVKGIEQGIEVPFRYPSYVQEAERFGRS